MVDLLPFSLSQKSVIELSEHVETPCVSIYLPTHRVGEETRQDPIRFKNLLRVAEERLQERGMRSRELEGFLAPARELMAESPFWWHLDDGLAAFLSPAGLRTLRLPWRFDASVVVGEHFHVKPLIRLLAYNGRFFVLALSLNRVRLLEASMFGATELRVDEVPTSLAQALGERDVERNLQARTVAPRGNGGGSDSMFHGTGEDASREKKEIEAFLRHVDQGTCDFLGHSTDRLVLAGVEYVTTIYRGINRYPHLVEDTVSGSPEEASVESLRKAAWDIVRPHFERAEEQAMEHYAAMAGTGRTSVTLEDSVRAAAEGRVALLLVAQGAEVWGRYDVEQGTITTTTEHAAGSEDLVDRACCQTLRTGGKVYVLTANRMPARSKIAAVLHF